MAQAIRILGSLHRVVHADEGNRQRHRRNDAQQIRAEKHDQHEAERHEHLAPYRGIALRCPAPDRRRECEHRHAAGRHRHEEDAGTNLSEDHRHYGRAERQPAQPQQAELEGDTEALELLDVGALG